MAKVLHTFPVSLRMILKSLAKYPVKSYSVDNISQDSASITQLCIMFNTIDEDRPLPVPAQEKASGRKDVRKFWFEKTVTVDSERKGNGGNCVVMSRCTDEARCTSSSAAAEVDATQLAIKTEPDIKPEIDAMDVLEPSEKIVQRANVESSLGSGLKGTDVPVNINHGDCPSIDGINRFPESNRRTPIQRNKILMKSIENTVSSTTDTIEEVSPGVEPEHDVRVRRATDNVVKDPLPLQTPVDKDNRMTASPGRCQEASEQTCVSDSRLVVSPPTREDVLYMKLADMSRRAYEFNPEPYWSEHGVFTITDFPRAEFQFILNRHDKKAGMYENIIPDGASTARTLICDFGVRCPSSFIRQLVARMILSSKHRSISMRDQEWFALLLN